MGVIAVPHGRVEGLDDLDAGFARLLSRHDAMRVAGVPVLTLLVEDGRSCAAAYRCWCRARGRPPIEVAPDQPGLEGLIARWLAGVAEHEDLEAHVLGAMVGGSGAGGREAALVERWSRLGEPERLAVIEGARERGRDGVAQLGDALRASSRQHGRFVDALRPTIATLRAVFEVLPPSSRSPLLVFDPGIDAVALLGALAELVDALPSIPVATILSRARYEYVVERTAGTRLGACLVEGAVFDDSPVVVAQASPSPAVTAVLRALGSTAGAPVPVALHELAEAAVEAVEALDHGPSPQMVDRARSMAERVLYEALQRRPGTAGAFELNVRMPFRFGPGRAEIDLYARSGNVAVEVDGWHHFASDHAYRTDRRKDVLLQRHGCFVLRFLARDVVGDTSAVVDTIESILRLRTGGRGSP